ncbi:Transposase, partial [Nereida ignava DSM 16309]
MPDATTAKIAALNDHARRSFTGCRVVITQGVQELKDIPFILDQVSRYNTFTPDNDPYGEHDFGSFLHGDTTIFWKIDGVDAPSHNGIAMCQTGFVGSQFKRKETSMSDISILAIDLAKHSFQVCATTAEGVVKFNRKYSRGKLSQLLAEHSSCLVAMEACATSHWWGRYAQEAGHEVRLIPPIYVKPFVK